jgi:hypothetical protein
LRNKEFGIFPIADSPVENMWIAERGKFTDRPKGSGEWRYKRINYIKPSVFMGLKQAAEKSPKSMQGMQIKGFPQRLEAMETHQS